MTRPYPLFLLLRDKLVLLVGGGAVAARKAAALLSSGARLRVVAEQVAPEMRSLLAGTDAELCERTYRDDDLEGVWLVVACTDHREVQRAIAAACERSRIFCLAVDDVENASAFGGAEVLRPPFTIAISTGGAAPALSRLVRELIEQVLPDEDVVLHATRLRERWKAARTPMDQRFGELVRELADKAHLGSAK